ncbi:CBS domain-containing protein [Buchnera aphidicola]|uniref:CBS domain-containing protein n=1 Tax=Buchnera aphidicola TaxID=9 RepID=UPI003464DF1E
MYEQEQKIKNKKNGFFSIFKHIPLKMKLINNKENLLEVLKSSKKHEIINNIIYKMLKKVIRTKKKRIRDIMIPINQITALKYHYSFKKCLDIIIKSNYSRFPVMSHNNHVTGILFAKDLLPLTNKTKYLSHIKNILKPVNIIPENKYINNILNKFPKQKHHMAIVIDEFGSVSGLITIQDILKEIFGISYKKNHNIIKKKKNNTRIFSIQSIKNMKIQNR